MRKHKLVVLQSRDEEASEHGETSSTVQYWQRIGREVYLLLMTEVWGFCNLLL